MTYGKLNTTIYKFHHKARHAGYVSRTCNTECLEAVPYNGRFGRGFYVDFPAYDSTRYCWRKYYIEEVTTDGNA